MFQRIKTAVDRTIANEQARQQSIEAQKPTAPGSSQRSNSQRPRGSGTQSPARKPRTAKKSIESADGDGVAANPDPAVFEAAFIIDETDEASTPARVATPGIGDKGKMNDSEKDPARAVDSQNNGAKEESVKGVTEQPERTTSSPALEATELSPEVKAKLKKLDKLEKTYPELLRSYRIAHGRVTSIEPFEKALRENTPLASIKDPDAFVEYLTQLNLKGDMVMDELKRVSGEKDTYKSKADQAEKELATLREELADLKPEKSESKTSERVDEAATGVNATPEEKREAKRGKDGKDGDEFFSYDNEIPQLQADVEQKTEEIQNLQAEVQILMDELSLAKEHSAGLVENLENVSRELSEFREVAAVKESVEAQLEARKAVIDTMTQRLSKAQARVKELETELETEKNDAAAAIKDKSTQLATSVTRYEGLESELKTVAENKAALDDKIGILSAEIDALKKTKEEDMAKMIDLAKKLESTLDLVPANVETPVAQETSLAPPASGSSKKKNKKKKKGGAAAAGTSDAPAALEPTASDVAVVEQPLPSPAETSASGEMQLELSRLREELAEKDERIEKLSKQRKTEEDLREEIENLQENMLLIGQEHVEAKDRIKGLEAEKKALQERISELEKQVDSSVSVAEDKSKLQTEYTSLKQECDDLNLRMSTLMSDLAAAQQLSQNRYKDITELREVLLKAQPELKSLRLDSAALKTTKEELAAKSAELRGLEKREKELKTEAMRAQRLAADREAEIKSLHDKITQETNARLRLEDDKRVAGRDLRRSEAEKIELSAKEEKATRELQRVQEEASKLRPRIRELEEETARLKKQQEVAREEAELKASQYASAQNLLGSMRDQTAELTIQLKESQSQCESLDEELAETRKMLGERTRETETMRRLLADVDERADSKVREMRDKMEAAVEERDRLEDESSSLARRKSRETEELKQKIRDLEREVKALAGQKDELEDKEREWRKRREELEAREERADREVNESQATVSNMRSTLDASEQQIRDVEKKNGELRRALDDYRLRYDKVSKEVKTLQGKLTSATSSPSLNSPGRGSMDSTRSGLNGGAQGNGGLDAIYLKTILLQFLEQKDNRLRAQLVPVLGKLLKFDKSDEQKWLAAVQQISR